MSWFKKNPPPYSPPAVIYLKDGKAYELEISLREFERLLPRLMRAGYAEMGENGKNVILRANEIASYGPKDKKYEEEYRCKS